MFKLKLRIQSSKTSIGPTPLDALFLMLLLHIISLGIAAHKILFSP